MGVRLLERLREKSLKREFNHPHSFDEPYDIELFFELGNLACDDALLTPCLAAVGIEVCLIVLRLLDLTLGFVVEILRYKFVFSVTEDKLEEPVDGKTDHNKSSLEAAYISEQIKNGVYLSVVDDYV